MLQRPSSYRTIEPYSTLYIGIAVHTSFRVFLNLKVFLLWALCLWSLDLSDISELPSPPPPETCLAFSPLVTEMKHATLFGSWVWFYKKMWTFSTKWLFFGLLELLCISENKLGKISSFAILIFDIKWWWKIILKYYSPTVAEGKTFVLVFCIL